MIKNKKNIYFIIPVFNENLKVLESVIRKIKKEGFEKIVLIDDGSNIYNKNEIENLSKKIKLFY